MSNILFFIYRAGLHQQRALGGFNVITKKRDQLYMLLAIVMTLCPQRIEDYVQRELMERCGEDIQKVYSSCVNFNQPTFLHAHTTHTLHYPMASLTLHTRV